MNFVVPADQLGLPVLDDNLRADRRDGMPETLYKINELLYLIASQGGQGGQDGPQKPVQEPPKDA